MSDAIRRLTTALAGRYRIQRQLGEGGMASVYLAFDVRHERKVAVKVLKPEVAELVGAERFLAEIRTTARLQHPHILPLHDSGNADGLLFYVMPYLEGESLRERLDRDRQLPVGEAVRITAAVAHGLNYAHQNGVVHRDIKPANILLYEGEPVVADFGIALAATEAGRLTETGVSVGTPRYMSPEQVTGDSNVGPPTDVYALGCVLYEMLVGEPPYTGSTTAAILGKVLLGTPPSAMSARRSVPPNVDAAVRKALDRLPADRFPDAQAFAEALTNPGFRYRAVASERGDRPIPRSWTPVTFVLAISTALLALALGWTLRSHSRAEGSPVARFEVPLGNGQGLVPGVFGVEFAISRDGARIVYVGAGPHGSTQLWERALDDLQAMSISGTEGATNPALSPDGRSVAFNVGGAVRKVPLAGGPSLTLAQNGGQPAWGSDGMVYFPRDSVIYRVPEGGGEAQPITSPAHAVQQWPAPLPDGRGLLLTLGGRSADESRIAVVGPRGGHVTELLRGTMARYAAPGYIVYARSDGSLWGVPFDAKRLEVTGEAVELAEDVEVKILSATQFAVSGTGTLLYKTVEAAQSDLVWVSRSGAVEPVDSTWRRNFLSPALSPDGTRVAVEVQGAATVDIWVKSLNRGPSLRLTFQGGLNRYPTWMPDGRAVSFYSNRSGRDRLWVRQADGSKPAAPLRAVERDGDETDWSADGAWLVYRTPVEEPGAGDIEAVRPGRDTVPVPLAATKFPEVEPALSPNGRWLAYASAESGRQEIYVVPFPNVGDGRWAISTDGGSEPVWAHGGRELFYRNARDEMVDVKVKTTPDFSVGDSRVLFPASSFRAGREHRQYDLSADDRRFIMIRRTKDEAAGRLILVQNFLAGVKGRARG